MLDRSHFIFIGWDSEWFEFNVFGFLGIISKGAFEYEDIDKYTMGYIRQHTFDCLKIMSTNSNQSTTAANILVQFILQEG